MVAGRLANLDHKLQVMLVEAGESNLNNPWVFRPGIFPRNMKLDSKTATFYYSRPSEWLAGRRAIVPCAHVCKYNEVSASSRLNTELLTSILLSF